MMISETAEVLNKAASRIIDVINPGSNPVAFCIGLIDGAVAEAVFLDEKEKIR